jgi:pyrroloquinoline quinone (PQQ) biosynthesis protein C
MPPADFEIRRLAHHLIHCHGDKAMAKAREKVEKMRRKGSQEGADLWLRIIVAIGEPPTEARH